MKKSLRIILVIGVVIGVVIAAILFSSNKLENAIIKAVDDIATFYVELSRDDALPLKKDPDLLSRDQRYLSQIEEAMKAIDQSASIVKRVDAIRMLQQSAHVFLLSLEESQSSVRDDPHYQKFARGMGEFSKIRKPIGKYNDLAGQWNTKSASLIGSLTSMEKEELPLLRFNGETPDIGNLQM